MAPYLDSFICEHTHWLCNKSDCDRINELRHMDCVDCGERRDEGVEALNRQGDTIGELEAVLSDGREHWVYYNGAASYVRFAIDGTRMTPRQNNRRHNRR